jgi:hypothetical protein
MGPKVPPLAGPGALLILIFMWRPARGACAARRRGSRAMARPQETSKLADHVTRPSDDVGLYDTRRRLALAGRTA